MRQFAIVSCLVLVLTAALSAQDYGTTEVTTKPMNFYLGAGAAFPLGSFNDLYDIGLHARGGVGFNITSVPGLQVMPVVEFHTFALNKDAYISSVPGATGLQVKLGATNIIMVGADGRYALTSVAPRISPYFIGGAGAAFILFGDRTFNNPPPGFQGGKPGNETKIFYNVGLGTEFALGSTMRLFVEGRFLGIPTSEVDFNMVPLTVGIRF